MREIAFQQSFLPLRPAAYLFSPAAAASRSPLVTAFIVSPRYFPAQHNVFVYGTKKSHRRL